MARKVVTSDKIAQSRTKRKKKVVEKGSASKIVNYHWQGKKTKNNRKRTWRGDRSGKKENEKKSLLMCRLRGARKDNNAYLDVIAVTA